MPVVVALLTASTALAGDPLEGFFDRDLKPLLKRYCVRCHHAEKQKAGLRVDYLDGKLEDRHMKTWERVLEQLKAGDMPPEEARQPSAGDRERAVLWVE